MKWLGIILAAIVAIPGGALLMIGSAWGGCGIDGGAAGAGGGVVAESAHVKNVHAIDGYNKHQMEGAAVIAKVAEQEKLGAPAQMMGIMAAIQETTLGTGSGWNKENGDHDAGWFQQRTLHGWYGSLKMVNDAEYGSRAFFKGVTARKAGDWGSAGGGGHLPGLVDFKSKWGHSASSYGKAIQAVQVSAYPEAYTKWYKDAKRILKALSGADVDLNGGDGGGSQDCGGGNEPGSGGEPSGDAKKGGVKLNNVWQYYQGDAPWAGVDYGESLAISGCGPTTTASVLTTFYPNRPTTPKAAAAYFKSHNGYVPGAGSAHIWPNSAMQKHFHYKTEDVSPSAANARRGIQKGGLVIISVNSATPFTGGGHIMMIRGLKGDKFLVGTSSGRGKKDSQNQNYKAFSASTFAFGSGTKAMFIITPTDKTDFKKRVVS